MLEDRRRVARLIAGVVLAVAACAPASALSPPSGIKVSNGGTKVAGNEPCALWPNRDWTARLSKTATDAHLEISGEIDAPTPGYRFKLTPGIADRRLPPAQHFNLTMEPPGGVSAQVITPTKVHYAGPGLAHGYRALRIICNGRVMAEIEGPLPGQ